MQWFKFWILTKTFKNCILVFSSFFFTNAYWYVMCNIQQSVFLFLAKLFILTDNWCFAGTDFQICQTASEHRHAEVVCMANVVWKKKKKKGRRSVYERHNWLLQCHSHKCQMAKTQMPAHSRLLLLCVIWFIFVSLPVSGRSCRVWLNLVTVPQSSLSLSLHLFNDSALDLGAVTIN